MRFSDIPDLGKLAPAPKWLEDLAVAPNMGASSSSSRRGTEEPLLIPEGQRNDWLFRRAASLRAQGFGIQEIYEMLLVANRRCDPPLPPQEVHVIAQSVLRYPAGTELGGTVVESDALWDVAGWLDAKIPEDGGGAHEEHASQKQVPEDRKLPATPDEWIERINERHAFVTVAGKAAVIRELTNPTTGSQDIVLMPLESFRAQLANVKLQIPGRTPAGKPAMYIRPLGNYWLEHPARRQYLHGVIFAPGVEDLPKGWYNLWRGWPIKPRQGDCSLYWEHLLKVVCQGNRQHYLYVRRWMAHAVQRPRERPQTAIVVIGGQGSGKGVWADHFGQLFGAHYLTVYRMDQVVGRFNAHLESTLVLYANEAIWGGDKQAEGALKGLVTDPTIPIERKGIDAYSAKNYIRLIVTSNEDWAVPQGADDRRFLVLRCSDERVGDRAYFDALLRQMRSGGLESLMWDLLHEDLSGWDPRHLPYTSEGVLNKLRSLHTVARWWYEVLDTGYNADPSDEGEFRTWADWVPAKELYDHYLRWCQAARVRRPETYQSFGRKLRELVPWLRRIQRTVDFGTKRWGYDLGSLESCRSALAELLRADPRDLWFEDQREDEKVDLSEIELGF